MRTLLYLIAMGSLLAAQERDPQPRPTTVRATGEARVSVHSDQSRVHLSVSSTAVIARLKELLGPNVEIRTENYRLNRTYPDGFAATNSIQIQLDDPAITGKVIDTATKAGANSINGVESSLHDEQAARVDALKQATTQARANAEAMAAALGMRVIRVVSAETVASNVIPVDLLEPTARLQRGAKRMAVTTPVEAGSTEIRAQVAVILEVAP